MTEVISDKFEQRHKEVLAFFKESENARMAINILGIKKIRK